MDSSSTPPTDHRSTVDTSSPFQSVKEAIAIYGEQLLARKLFASHCQKIAREDFVTLTSYEETIEMEAGQRIDLPCVVDDDDHLINDDHHVVNDDDDHVVNDDDDHVVNDNDHGYDDDYNKDLDAFAKVLKKLEDELEETKHEIKLLKDRESETEVALASLNAELHKNMSKIATLEANEATYNMMYVTRSSFLDKGKGIETRFEAEKTVRNARKGMEDRPTLEQILSFGVCEGYFMKSKEVAKKKPVVPLVTDVFACMKKKKPPTKDKDDLAFLCPLYYFR